MPRVDYYRREDGLYDWRLFAANGEQLCESHQGYTSEANAREGFRATFRAIAALVGGNA
jgi:uncharacterized protein YegP (UPF0339 family)